jgi:hypothetical protein
LFGAFEFLILVLVSNFACLREAAPAKAGISGFEFKTIQLVIWPRLVHLTIFGQN